MGCSQPWAEGMNHPLQGASTEPLHPTCQNRMSRFIPLALHSLLSGGSRVVSTCFWLYRLCRCSLLHSGDCFHPTPLVPPCCSCLLFPSNSESESRHHPGGMLSDAWVLQGQETASVEPMKMVRVLSMIHPMSRSEIAEGRLTCVCSADTETR
jgi:hypothetical protein